MKNFATVIQIIICCLLFCMCTAQQKISGDYSHRGIAEVFHFGDSLFTKIDYSHIGPLLKTVSKGSYKLKGDTLYLNYRSLDDQDPSSWRFIKKRSCAINKNLSQDSLCFQTKFRVVNKKGDPLSETLLILVQENQKSKAFEADSMGYFPKISQDVRSIKKFWFTNASYKGLTINRNKVIGYKSEVEVILSSSNIGYSEFEGTKVYLIKKVTGNRLVLQSIEGSEIMVLERRDSDNQ